LEANKLTDDEALNKLQSGVSQRITQLRKPTILPKTTPFPMIADETNADLEETAVWSQLHQELQSIQSQLTSPGVEVTLRLLREAKRFVATLALENNKGLEQAVSYTQDVEHLLKSYPVVEFQTARDFEKISHATNAIFDHLPKIRLSRYYSLERSAQLLEATTLTLRRIVEYDASKFQGVIESIQKAIDERSLSGYSNLASWVKVLDDRLANVLERRRTMALESWNCTFKVQKTEEVDAPAKMETVAIPQILVEILLRNQAISAVPAVPTVRSLFFEYP
jgi:hypothetical protein